MRLDELLGVLEGGRFCQRDYDAFAEERTAPSHEPELKTSRVLAPEVSYGAWPRPADHRLTSSQQLMPIVLRSTTATVIFFGPE